MFRNSLLLIVLLSMTGCKYLPSLDEVIPDKQTDYKKSKTLPDLEVPPDLSSETIQDKMAVPDSGSATFSTYQERVAERKKERVAAGTGENSVTALTGERVLVVNGSTAAVWEKLHSFWTERGYKLNLDDAEYGVQETEWRENKADLVRDKFKIFAEAGEKPGTTTLYISHEGEDLKPEGEELTWKARPGDGKLEEKFVAELDKFMAGGSEGVTAAAAGIPAAAAADATAVEPAATGGVAEAAPAPKPAAQKAAAEGGRARTEIVTTSDGKFYLALLQEFTEAWHSTGEALAKAGLTVDEADKERGVYLIRYANGPAPEKKGMLSKLAFWRKDKSQYQISLTGVGKKTEIVVLDADGKWDTGETASQILNMLQTELDKTS